MTPKLTFCCTLKILFFNQFIEIEKFLLVELNMIIRELNDEFKTNIQSLR